MANNGNRGFYGESLKRQVVREYESGYFSKTVLCSKYGILSLSTLTNWCNKYGILAGEKKKAVPILMKGTQEKVKNEESSRAEAKRSTEQLRISELEKELETMRLRAQLYLKIIEVSSEDLGEDLLKKTGIALSKVPTVKDG
jgi:transposase-like protein